MCFRTNLISRGIALLGVPAKSEPGSTWTTFFFSPSLCVCRRCGLPEKNMRSEHGIVWMYSDSYPPSYYFSSCLSFCLSPSISPPLIHLPPVFPSLLISRLLMKALVQRHTHTEMERGRGGTERYEREEFWTNCLFVKTCPAVCLFACLLLWCESLNELPARTTTQRLLFGFPFHVPLYVRARQTENQPWRVRERLITCFHNGD